MYCIKSKTAIKVEKHINNPELTLKAEVTQLKNQVENDSSSKAWWEQIAGTFANNSAYDEAMRLGREYRNSVGPSFAEPSDE